MTITETINWTLLDNKWPEEGDDKLSLVVFSYDRDGCAHYGFRGGCTCYYDEVSQTNWFVDENGNDIDSHIAAWAPEPTGQPVIDFLKHKDEKPRNSLIPFESELS